jgi:hypothetical protein
MTSGLQEILRDPRGTFDVPPALLDPVLSFERKLTLLGAQVALDQFGAAG